MCANQHRQSQYQSTRCRTPFRAFAGSCAWYIRDQFLVRTVPKRKICYQHRFVYGSIRGSIILLVSHRSSTSSRTLRIGFEIRKIFSLWNCSMSQAEPWKVIISSPCSLSMFLIHLSHLLNQDLGVNAKRAKGAAANIEPNSVLRQDGLRQDGESRRLAVPDGSVMDSCRSKDIWRRKCIQQRLLRHRCLSRCTYALCLASALLIRGLLWNMQRVLLRT